MYPEKYPQKKVTVKEAETIALDALSYLAADDARLSRFLDVSGLEPQTIRRAAADPGFLAGVLDYLVSDEPLLLGFAASVAAKPEAVMAARSALSPSEFE
jgi:hypothetical protein